MVSEFSNQVIGAQASQVGNFVCTSGAYSGTRCSIQVKARNLCINVRNFATVCGQVQAEAPSAPTPSVRVTAAARWRS
ncbi:hypothetical protein NKG94_18145 [Micromonospora sp. M12]